MERLKFRQQTTLFQQNFFFEVLFLNLCWFFIPTISCRSLLKISFLWFSNWLFQLFQDGGLPVFLCSSMTFCFCFMNQRVVAILYHVLVSHTLEEFRDEGPFFPMFKDWLKQKQIFLLVPRAFFKVRKTIVHPLFPALLFSFVNFAPWSDEQHVWNLTPLKRAPGFT